MSARKVLLITGGSRGIGAATARLGAARGYDIAISYVSRPDAARTVARDVEAAGARCVVVEADTGRPDDVARLFADVDAAFGGRLDAVFNNAGLLGAGARFVDLPLAQIQRVIAVNTVGAFLVAQGAARRLSTRTGGSGGAIVNMSSMAAKLGGAGELTDYAVSKGAIDTLTIGLAKELAPEGVRVNAVRPGLIYTDIHAGIGVPDRVDKLAPTVPMRRGGTPEEVAETVLWLLSDAASYVTGQLVDIAGGRGL
jgi:NAD(P)-dependent dehydrogenase (short-subunit alcohol dehydrogenase family)